MRLSRRAAIAVGVALSWAAWAHRPAVALREPDDRWIAVQGERIALFGDIAESQGRTLVLQLDRLRHVLAGVAPALRTDPSRPLYVYAFGEDASFGAYARKQGVDPGVGGLSFTGADGGYYIMINAGGEVRTFGVLYHEYLHRVVVDTFPDLPLCLNEGMAEFFNTFWSNGYQAEIGAPIAEHLDLLAGAPLLPLETLFGVTPQSVAYSDATVKKLFHAESWLLVHYLLQGRHELRGAVPRYLQAVREGAADVAAFEEILAIDLETLESDLATYLRRGVLPNSTIDFQEPIPETGIVVSEMSDGDVHFSLGRLLASGRPDGHATAERHLASALALDPEDAASLTAMADLRHRQGRADDAAVYERMAEASALLSRGETAEAVAALRDALSATTDAAARRRLQNRIRQIGGSGG